MSSGHDLTLADRCRRIEMLILDVDGVLTEGGIAYAAGRPGSETTASGVLEWKQFHVRDGSALKIWREAGKHVTLLSGRASQVVVVRAAELGIRTLVQGASDKGAALVELLAGCGLQADQAAFVGDDLADVPALRRCGLAIAVADACPDVLRVAHHVTLRLGGRGAVREVIERILRCQGKWPNEE